MMNNSMDQSKNYQSIEAESQKVVKSTPTSIHQNIADTTNSNKIGGLDEHFSFSTPLGDIDSSPTEHARIVAIDRKIKLRFIFNLVINIPFVTYICMNVYNLDDNDILGVLLLICHISYFLSLYLSVYRSNHLYRIEPRYKLIKNWAYMPLPYHIDEYPQYAIQSISEFSSIRGSITNLFLYTVGLFTFTSYYSLYLEYETNPDFSNKVDSYFAFGGGLGLLWIGLFELNPNDKFHQIMHYIGVTLCCGSNIAFCIQQEFNLYSISLFGGLILFCFIWRFICYKYAAKSYGDNIKLVTRISIACIVSESILLAFGAIAFDSYLFYYNQRN